MKCQAGLAGARNSLASVLVQGPHSPSEGPCLRKQAVKSPQLPLTPALLDSAFSSGLTAFTRVLAFHRRIEIKSKLLKVTKEEVFLEMTPLSTWAIPDRLQSLSDL